MQKYITCPISDYVDLLLPLDSFLRYTHAASLATAASNRTVSEPKTLMAADFAEGTRKHSNTHPLKVGHLLGHNTTGHKPQRRADGQKTKKTKKHE